MNHRWFGRVVTTEGSPSLIDLAAEGVRTDLASGMLLAQSGFEGTHADAPALPPQTAAVVFMSDGRDNIGRSPMDAAERLNASGIEVHAIGIGSRDEPVDVGIVDVIRPESVASDGQLAGEVVLKTLGVGDARRGSRQRDLADRVGWSRGLARNGDRILRSTIHSVRTGCGVDSQSEASRRTSRRKTQYRGVGSSSLGERVSMVTMHPQNNAMSVSGSGVHSRSTSTDSRWFQPLGNPLPSQPVFTRSGLDGRHDFVRPGDRHANRPAGKQTR